VGSIQALGEFLSLAHLEVVFAANFCFPRPGPTSRKMREKWATLASL
jgi:hypothetical protein